MGYIDTDKLIKFANNSKDKTIDANDIARFPIADVRENVRGYWEKRKDKPLQNWYQCSNCGAICGETPKYCSECGADMRGDKS